LTSLGDFWEVADNYPINVDEYAFELMLLTHQEEIGKDGVKGDKIQWNSIGVFRHCGRSSVTLPALDPARQADF
jgi:hypothetical protein